MHNAFCNKDFWQCRQDCPQKGFKTFWKVVVVTLKFCNGNTRKVFSYLMSLSLWFVNVIVIFLWSLQLFNMGNIKLEFTGRLLEGRGL